MSCVTITRPQREVLDLLAERETLPAGDLEQQVFDELVAWGWVYEHRGLVELTGAGAYHAGTAGKAGLLD